ncbi:MAG: hypothetical protein HOC70_16200 [Gammaproteobacteria bacterium]|jgi:hypothetical protein|nr:hypothetical protein [Gammaproteobacteria bacterium]MBT7371330.1 hypothetical protein [Gammaproteobacteria bacterium]
MKRRSFLIGCAAVPSLSALPRQSEATEAKAALTESNLIYLSPVKSNGELSSCQSELWYAMVGADVFVCTATESWRSRAPRRGNTKTRLWVGDLGYWKNADYQSLPSIITNASVETDADAIEAALVQFGQKYVAEWGKWESKFRDGLADGSRSMMRYAVS